VIGVGYSLALAFVFLAHTRLAELLLPGLRLQLVFAAGALLMALVAGTIVRPFTSRIGIALLLLTLCFCAGVPFSVNRMASLNYITSNWVKHWALFVMVVALVNSRRQFYRLTTAIAIGSTVMAAVALVKGPGPKERLGVTDTSLNDPNLLGMTLLIGLLLWMIVIGDRSRFLTTRLGAGLCLAPIFVVMALTGSRGTLVAGVIVAGFLLKRFSIVGKAGLVAIICLVVVLSATFLGEGILERYGTVTDPDQIDTTASSESRVHLFQQGLHLIARNPIFGVGIGMFAWAENELAQDQGYLRGSWHTCHNMYMEVASEAGLPAFALYMFILVTVWQSLGRLERIKPEEHPRAAQIARMSFWMKAAFLAYCACGLFLSSGLSHTFVIMVSLPVALVRVVTSEMNQLAEESIEKADAAADDELVVPVLVRGLRSQE
jgi:O-antigen ligase